MKLRLTLALSHRLHWLNLPGVLLVALLQRTPVLRVAATAGDLVIASPFGQLLRSAATTAASLGALHSLTGATQFVQNPAGTINGTVGTAVSVGFTITGSPQSPSYFILNSALPPGLVTSPALQGDRINSQFPTITGTPTQAGTFFVSVTGTDGNYSRTDTITFSITGGATLPVITTQPGNQIVNPGATATFTVAASGSPTPTYQWRKDGSPLAGATTATLTLANVTTANAGTYSALAANSAGSTPSNGATLTVNVAPTITTQPASQNATAGSDVTFTVAATGTPAPTYQWLKNGTALAGATAATLTLDSISPAAAAAYSVTLTNSAGTITSSGATLTLTVAPAISTQPIGQIAIVGSSLTLSVAATGTPAPTYQWLKNGTALAGATGTTLLFPSVAFADAATYSVRVTNSAGSVTSSNAPLTVHAPPAITTQPMSQTTTVGATVTLTVVATGSPTPSYQWRKDGTPLAGAVNAALTLANVSLASAGAYTVVLTNSAGTITSASAALSVSAAPAAPAITTSPANQAALGGGTATFTVTASGNPAPTYQWQKDGAALAGATTATLTLANLTPASAGTYAVVVASSLGSVTSAGAVLTVSAASTAPAIITAPTAQIIAAGGTVTFSVVATGSPAPTFQWFKNDVALAGANTASLTLGPLLPADAGSYSVRATNIAGTITSAPAPLTVNAPAGPLPEFLAPPSPASVTIAPGGTVVLSAAATGAASFRWQRNGADLPDATSPRLVLPNATGATAGTYRLVATNPAGSVPSAPATVAVQTVTPAEASRLINLSILTKVSVADPLFTLGFVLGGAGTSGTKPLVVRAVGPSLAAFGVAGTLADPKLDLLTGSTVFASNNDWAGAVALSDAFVQVGAFPLASPASQDAALFNPATPARDYTVQIGSNVPGAAGSVIAELYDATPAAAITAAKPRLINVSVRQQIDAGTTLTAGFVIGPPGGPVARSILIRAIGPGLAAFGVPATMPDPKLELFSGSTVIAANDNWGGDPQLTAAGAAVGAFVIADSTSKDAMLLLTLTPGNYTVQVSGVATGGVALVEVYEVP